MLIGAVALIAVVLALASGGAPAATQPVTTINYSAPGSLNASQQQSFAYQSNIYIPADYFKCESNSDCTLVHTSYCNNNLPSQFACINKGFYPQYMVLYNASIGPEPHICPLFLLDIKISCYCDAATGTCQENYT